MRVYRAPKSRLAWSGLLVLVVFRSGKSRILTRTISYRNEDRCIFEAYLVSGPNLGDMCSRIRESFLSLVSGAVYGLDKLQQALRKRQGG